MNFRQSAVKIGEELAKSLPKYWDGKQCILEMKNAHNRQWKQMEWPGFFFQYCCETYLSSIMRIPGPKYGRSEFDGLFNIPWDFKAHAINTSSHNIIVNDREAIENGIEEYGSVGLILALGAVTYNDVSRAFQKWHQELKGGQSDYELERVSRGAWSRLRKSHFDLKQISFIELTAKTLSNCGSFQRNFRNADGSLRREKVLIDLENTVDETIHYIEI